jgi:asparagine synthase (glutamine-hydrolysing)
MGAKNELERFLRVFSIFTANQKQNIFKQEYQQTIKEDHGEIISKLYDQVAHRKDSLSKMLHIDIRTMLPDNLLLFNDKITMSKSIENRVPYLDIDVVNFVESLPTNYKIKHYQQKYLHKKAVSEWLPQQILNRKKKGFLTPVDSWLQGNLNTVMQDIILSPNSACNQYFEADYLKNLFQEHQKRKANYNRHLFSLVSFELWHKSFFQ